MILSKEYLKNLKIRKTVESEIPGLDGKAKFRELGGVERYKFVSRLKALANNDDGIDFDKLPEFAALQVDMVAECLIDQSENLVIEQDEEKELLKNLPHQVLDKMFEICQDLNGFSAEDEAEKN